MTETDWKTMADALADIDKAMKPPLMYGGGLRHGHTHMATVSYPVKDGNGNNGTCPACIAIEGFLAEAEHDGWHMTNSDSRNDGL